MCGGVETAVDGRRNVWVGSIQQRHAAVVAAVIQPRPHQYAVHQRAVVHLAGELLHLVVVIVSCGDGGNNRGGGGEVLHGDVVLGWFARRCAPLMIVTHARQVRRHGSLLRQTDGRALLAAAVLAARLLIVARRQRGAGHGRSAQYVAAWTRLEHGRYRLLYPLPLQLVVVTENKKYKVKSDRINKQFQFLN